MRTVNIREAKSHLAELVDQAAKGESFVIAKYGKSLVKVVAINTPSGHEIRRADLWLAKSASPTTSTGWVPPQIEQRFSAGE